MATQSRLCPQCGNQVSGEARFCAQCGSPAPSIEPRLVEAGAAVSPGIRRDSATKSHQGAGEVSWEVSVPLLTDQFVMYDLLKVWGISSLCLFLLMIAIFIYERNWPAFLGIAPMLGFVSAGILVLFILVMLFFFGNRYPMGFAIGPKSALMVGLSQRGRWGNRLAVILGALAGKPGLAGAGLLAMARESVGVSWDEVRRINVHPEARVISLMDSWHVVMRLYCTPENYPMVLESVQKWAARGLKKAAATPRPRGLSPGLRLGLKSLGAAAAAFFISALPLEAPPVLIWALLAVGLWATWFVAGRRFCSIVSLTMVGIILFGFVAQGLEVRQTTNPEDFRKFAASRGVKVDKVPDWIIGRYRRYEHFQADDWLRTGIGMIGLAFFAWVGLACKWEPKNDPLREPKRDPPLG
jgi:hypothetical protein